MLDPWDIRVGSQLGWMDENHAMTVFKSTVTRPMRASSSTVNMETDEIVKEDEKSKKKRKGKKKKILVNGSLHITFFIQECCGEGIALVPLIENRGNSL